MSYQFEDDSALEELLNQQLDRRKQQTLSARPTTSSSSGRVQQTIRPSSSRLNNEPQADKIPPVRTDLASGSSRGKLASWLASSTPQAAPDATAASGTVLSQKRESRSNDEPQQVEKTFPVTRKSSVSLVRQETLVPDKRKSTTEPKLVLESICDESELQGMSKQRLIEFILEEIKPNIDALIESSDSQIRNEVERMREELEEEKNRHRLREEQQIGLVELKWQQLNRQLELRLETSENDLIETRSQHKLLMKELDDEFKRQMKQVSENYKQRLEEEKQAGEEALRRSQEMHRLELDSKLKANAELDKLETTFAEWQRMVRLTVSELGEQLQSIERLLEKQTLEVNATNVNLAQKSQQLSEHYAKFELQTGRLEELRSKLSGDILPQLTLAQEGSQSAIDKMNLQLEQLSARAESLEKEKFNLEQRKHQLETTKEELAKEKFQLALDSNRISFSEEKLKDLIERNTKADVELREEREVQRQKEAKLAAMESGLDSKSKKLRELNYELHLVRKRLASREEQLAKEDVRLNERAASLEAGEKRLVEERRRLEELRNRIKRESDQLCRLQKSLICSLCFGSLFGDGNQSLEQNFQDQKLPRAGGGNLYLADALNAQGNPWRRQCSTDHHPSKGISRLAGDDEDDYYESDAKQLESECKYVDLLPIS